MSRPAVAADRPWRPLYTAEQRARRDASVWTRVQGGLAPAQFLVCLASVVLVVRFLATGHGHGAAEASVIAKTAALYAIMITGAIWEKAVFGRYLFAAAFFWEDAVSMIVIALHTLSVALIVAHAGTAALQFGVALAGYAAYALNAAQFLLKLRAARREAPAPAAVALA